MKETRWVLLQPEINQVARLAAETREELRKYYAKEEFEAQGWLACRVEVERPPKKVVRWGWKHKASPHHFSGDLYATEADALRAYSGEKEVMALFRMEWEE